VTTLDEVLARAIADRSQPGTARTPMTAVLTASPPTASGG